MSWRFAARSAVRVTVIVSVALAGMTFGADDADARRGGRVRSAPHQSQDRAALPHKPDGAENGENAGRTFTPVPRVRSRDASHGESSTAADAGNSVARRPLWAGPVAPLADRDLDVEGCNDGMICTVCLAGCYGDVGGIVDTQVKTPMPEPRR